MFIVAQIFQVYRRNRSAPVAQALAVVKLIIMLTDGGHSITSATGSVHL